MDRTEELKQFVEQCRRPFPPEQIGKLPKVTCRDCTQKRCQKHTKQKCKVCDSWISTAHIHLDFVGHAVTRARLLEIDPEWTWEPMALDEDGLPKLKEQGPNTALWIRLTLGGITRPGVGTESTGNPELLKILIGDAIRNAAMSFGVALDIWNKNEEIRSFEDDDSTESGSRSVQERPQRREKARKGDNPRMRSETQDGPEGPPEGSQREALMTRWLTIGQEVKPHDLKDLRATLAEMDLWPILDVPEDRASEALAVIGEAVGS